MRFTLAAVLALAISIAACASAPPPAPSGATLLRQDVFVEKIAPRTWRHVSYWHFPGAGPIPSNGLIVEGSKGVIVVDTAWNDEQTALILDWIEANVGPVHAFVITHAHNDRLGGIGEVDRRRIPSYALADTVERAAEAGWPPISDAVASPFRLDDLGIRGELLFPGAAHTRDNATVWLEEERILVGGCMVRAAEAEAMGNTSEGDLEAWPRSIAVLEARYPNAQQVIPGHGAPGGRSLLSHTRSLLAERNRTSPRSP